MTDMLEMTRTYRSGQTGRAGFAGGVGMPCALAGTRFRQNIRHENAHFMQATGRP